MPDIGRLVSPGELVISPVAAINVRPRNPVALEMRNRTAGQNCASIRHHLISSRPRSEASNSPCLNNIPLFGLLHIRNKSIHRWTSDTFLFLLGNALAQTCDVGSELAVSSCLPSATNIVKGQVEPTNRDCVDTCLHVRFAFNGKMPSYNCI